MAIEQGHILLQKIVQRLDSLEIATSANLRGCNEVEIKGIELKFGIRLPRMYREFLSIMGRKAGDFLTSGDILYPDLLELQEWAQELIACEEIDFTLPEDAFVFMVYGNHAIWYFHRNDGDDPPVYCFYLFGKGEPQKKFDNFYDFLERELEVKEEALERTEPEAELIDTSIPRGWLNKKSYQVVPWLKERLQDLNFEDESVFQGLENEVVSDLERDWGVTFPKVYRDFLHEFGHSTGDYFLDKRRWCVHRRNP